DLAAHRRDADAVAIAADTGDHAIEVVTAVRQRPEAQGVKQRDRARPHRDHIPEDASDPCRRTLVRLDGAGMVVRLDLEDDRPTLPDLHGPRLSPPPLPAPFPPR